MSAIIYNSRPCHRQTKELTTTTLIPAWQDKNILILWVTIMVSNLNITQIWCTLPEGIHSIRRTSSKWRYLPASQSPRSTARTSSENSNSILVSLIAYVAWSLRRSITIRRKNLLMNLFIGTSQLKNKSSTTILQMQRYLNLHVNTLGIWKTMQRILISHPLESEISSLILTKLGIIFWELHGSWHLHSNFKNACLKLHLTDWRIRTVNLRFEEQWKRRRKVERIKK